MFLQQDFLQDVCRGSGVHRLGTSDPGTPPAPTLGRVTDSDRTTLRGRRREPALDSQSLPSALLRACSAGRPTAEEDSSGSLGEWAPEGSSGPLTKKLQLVPAVGVAPGPRAWGWCSLRVWCLGGARKEARDRLCQRRHPDRPLNSSSWRRDPVGDNSQVKGMSLS